MPFDAVDLFVGNGVQTEANLYLREWLCSAKEESAGIEKQRSATKWSYKVNQKCAHRVLCDSGPHHSKEVSRQKTSAINATHMCVRSPKRR